MRRCGLDGAATMRAMTGRRGFSVDVPAARPGALAGSRVNADPATA